MQNRALIALTLAAALLAITAPAALQGQATKPSASKPVAPSVSASVNARFPSGKIYSRPASVDANALPEEKPAITSANGTFKPFTNGNQPTNQTKLESIASSSQTAIVQVALNFDQVAGYLRAARNFDEKLQTIKVADDKGFTTSPSGYMLQKGDNLIINLASPGSMDTISQIKAMDQVQKDDTLYLIFHVPKKEVAITLVKFIAANKTATLNLVVK
jgi:hypothetical protein